MRDQMARQFNQLTNLLSKNFSRSDWPVLNLDYLKSFHIYSSITKTQ